LLARLGDEEFACLCRDVDALRASRAASRLRALVAARVIEPEPDSPSSEPLRLTLSLGVADLGLLHEPTAEALMKAAESALQLARRADGDRVEIYDPENEPTRLV